MMLVRLMHSVVQFCFADYTGNQAICGKVDRVIPAEKWLHHDGELESTVTVTVTKPQAASGKGKIFST